MKKKYIAPSSIVNCVRGKTDILGRGQVGINAHYDASLFNLSAAKERDSEYDVDTDNSDSGFGSNDSPWEKLW